MMSEKVAWITIAPRTSLEGMWERRRAAALRKEPHLSITSAYNYLSCTATPGAQYSASRTHACMKRSYAAMATNINWNAADFPCTLYAPPPPATFPLSTNPH